MTKPKIISCPNFSSLHNVKHGFFTRKGGVSEGIYASLNVGLGSNDDKNNVHTNRTIAMQEFGAEADALQTLYQIHSDTVITVTEKSNQREEADAMVTNQKNIVLGILTADCTPVLFADENAKVIGAAHAGWKGACSGILENTVIAMQNLGADVGNIKAVIGPTITQSSYEVGDDFYERFLGFSPENKIFFIHSQREGHYMFNLPSYVEARLAAIGIKSVTNVNRDTCADAENFFSYRRTCLNKEADYGRNLSVIVVSS
jgi:YfiH family protein